MSFFSEISFDAIISGDNECFCWRDIPEAFKREKRLSEEYYEDDSYEGSESYKEIHAAMKEARIDSLYPGDIWRLFNLKDNVKYKFTIKVEEVNGE